MDGFIWNFTGEPFAETPGHLVFRRFAIALVFSNRRGGVRLNGSVPLDGSILLDQGNGGVRLKRFGAGSAFSHPQSLNGMVTMDNWYTLDGGFSLDGSKNLNAYIKKEDL